MTHIWKRVEPRLNFIDERIDNAEHDRMTDALAVMLGYDQLMELRGQA